MVAIDGTTIHIILHQNATAEDCLRGYVHALYLRAVLERSENVGFVGSTDAAEIESLTWMTTTYKLFLKLVSH